MDTLTLIYQDHENDQTVTFSMTFASTSTDELEDFYSRASQAIGHSWVKSVEVKGETFSQRAERLAKVAGASYSD